MKTITRQKAAELLDVSPDAVDKAVQAGKIARIEGGKLTEQSVLAYRAKRKKSKKTSADAKYWMTLFRREKALRARWERRQATGELIEKAEAFRQFAKAFDSCRQLLLSIPNTLAPTLLGLTDPEQVREILHSQITGAMTALAEQGKKNRAESRNAKTESEKAQAELGCLPPVSNEAPEITEG